MKFHKIFWLCLILSLILGGGCWKASVTSALTSPTASTILTGTSTRTPVSTLPPSPTHTLTPTATFTIAPTHTPTPSSTPTAIPTLSIEDAHARLLELLADNGGCRLPCLWGIMPGETTYQEGQVLLAPFAGISNYTAFKSGIGNITPYIVLDDLIVYISVDILAKNNIVTQVHFSGAAYREMVDQRGVENIYDSTLFGEKLEPYMLSQILSEYGPPGSVMVSTWAEIPSPNLGTGYFKILLLYPDLGILAVYTTGMRIVGENVLGCPANAHVELKLRPGGKVDEFYNSLGLFWEKEVPEYFKPLDEVTSMSVDSFYRTFRQPTSQCLITPSSWWPVLGRY
jgi:hypothetical protein